MKQSNESVQSKQSISAKQSAGSGKNHYDTTLLVVIWILVAVGLVLMYSTSSYNGLTKFHDRFYYLKKQGFATILGLVGMFVTAGIDYHKWSPVCSGSLCQCACPVCCGFVCGKRI